MEARSQTPGPRLTVQDAGPVDGADLRSSVRQALVAAGVARATLLGWALDGCLWGDFDGSQVRCSDEFAGCGAALRAQTLVELSAFDGQRELRVWLQDDRGLQAAWLSEDAQLDPLAMTVLEAYPLIGSHQRAGATKPAQAPGSTVSFTVMTGRAGEVHAPPIAWRGGAPYPRLFVKHYYTRAQDGIWELVDTRKLRVGLEGSGERDDEED